MNEIEKAKEYFEDAVRETDEIIEDCSKAIQEELLNQKTHFVTALKVLKQQQERDQGCKYCTREKDIQIKFEGEEAGRAWMHNSSDGYGLFLEGEVITYIDVKYCPMCGRKLEVLG